MDLSDEQIDRLLSEAESRLAVQDSPVAAPSNRNKLAIPSALTAVVSTTELPKGQAKLPEGMTVRVPKPPKTKKKVCSTYLDPWSPACPFALPS